VAAQAGQHQSPGLLPFVLITMAGILSVGTIFLLSTPEEKHLLNRKVI
jgi:hypothetical protein